ncbi:MAG: phytanoyl-CoA dioxygenase family protein [Sphingobium sp.]
MKLEHFPSSAPVEEITGCVRENGYAIVDRVASADVMDRFEAEISPYLDAADYGADEFCGRRTKRVGSLVARSPTFRDIVMDRTITGVAGELLSQASTFQLHLTQLIEVHPGAGAQELHQDQLVWDMYPFPDDYHVQCNTLWAVTDYTDEMGATRIVPGSHKAGVGAQFTAQDTLPAEMDRGSVLVYTGKVYHGAGANRSQRMRRAISLMYSVGWVRQEENQYLSCPQDIAQTLPEDLLKLMGYQCGCYGLGYIRDVEDPIAALKEDSAKTFNPGPRSAPLTYELEAG